MPEDLAVNREDEAGALTNALDQPVDGVGRERAAPLGREDEATVWELPMKLPEYPDLVRSAADGRSACRS
jgi:hypothetical protein